MLRKLSLASLLFIVCSNFAMANHMHNKDMNRHKHNDDNNMAMYKGEVQPMPAPHYYYNGPYLGVSLGDRVNYTSTPTVYNGLEGNLSAGYAFVMESFYFAGEIFVGDSAVLQNYANNGSARSTWSYGLSLIPGILMNDTVLGYLRLGILNTNFTTNNNNATGGQVGLGLQTAITERWDLRGEYIYDFYRSVSYIGNPKSAQFNLGLVYKI